MVWGHTLSKGNELLRIGYTEDACWVVLGTCHSTGIHIAFLQGELQKGKPSGFWLWKGERFIMMKGDKDEMTAVFDLTLEEIVNSPLEFLNADPA